MQKKPAKKLHVRASRRRYNDELQSRRCSNDPDEWPSALCALKDVLEGKALIYDACTETPHHGLNPCEGITLKLADAPDMGCDMMITFLPYLSDDGRALLKIDCYSVPYQSERSAVRENDPGGRMHLPGSKGFHGR